VLVGRGFRLIVRDHHLDPDTRDVVKLAMGLVATMSALLLGLLVSSAKGSYDTVRSEVIQMAAKIAFLDRVLTIYGAEAAETRGQFHHAVDEAIRRMWPADKGEQARLDPDVKTGGAVMAAIQRLSPNDEAQRNLRTQALSLAVEIGQLHSLLEAQMVTSISKPLLIVVVSWLFVIFVSFSVLAPRNTVAMAALLASAASSAAAIFLILELDRPFGGLIRISSEPMLNAVRQMAH
jgi:hypothetical protein